MSTSKRPAAPFSSKLALHRWLLGLFGCKSLDELATHLKGDELVGFEADNVHQFCTALRFHISRKQRPDLPGDRLLEADRRIVAITQKINGPRLSRGKREVRWLYFQYLALLATDIYLERWFSDPRQLLADLNQTIDGLNADLSGRDRLEPLDASGHLTDAANRLNKLAFWMATGSGKTLLMHAHLLLYREWLRMRGRQHELNRTILLTPNEGLSRQHLGEFEAAGIAARPFDRNNIPGAWVEVLDVHKLADDMGDKTVAVSAFEGANLVLVDEGHRGASSGEQGKWMRRRDALCERGFSFEYSATFGQAVAADKKLTDTYARAILFDYSYRWFHGDGYGKDFRIFNLEGRTDDDDDWERRYLTAALLSFFQQQWLYRQKCRELEPWQVEAPLWVFVGSKVIKKGKKDLSDVTRILQFLSRYSGNPTTSTAHIYQLLQDGLPTTGGKNLFAGHFDLLRQSGMTAERLFPETLATTFNAAGGGALRIERLKGSSGELTLRLGENEPFGVINVGDASALAKACEDAGLQVTESEFKESVFDRVNQRDSRINLVIGARKFTEGWNSWRVSSMGLMNVGKSEGAQIIQMFGRGVRLRGRGMSLKRSSELHEGAHEAPAALPALETLQVFGVQANYMTQFREFLEKEGVAADREEVFLPIRHSELPNDPPLPTIRLAKGVAGNNPEAAFRRRGPMPVLVPPGEAPTEIKSRLCPAVRLDWNPKVRTLSSDESGTEVIAKHEQSLACRHLRYLDLDDLYFDLVRFKTQRDWHNLTVSRTAVHQLLLKPSWYRLQAPESLFKLDDWTKVRQWQEIAATLLRKYTARYYGLCRQAWEARHMEIQPLTDDDPNLQVTGKGGSLPGFLVRIASATGAAGKTQVGRLRKSLDDLRTAIDSGELSKWNDGDVREVRALRLDEHLYWPLLSVQNDKLILSPPALNEGEYQFVRDLQTFLQAKADRLSGVRIHLMRNQSRGRGIGFFEANSFHPDFILWALKEGRQHIAFIDPKGLVHLGPENPKVMLHQTIKDIEKRLRDDQVRLESFIVSVTSYEDLGESWSADGRRLTRAELADRHVLFREQNGAYIDQLFARLGVL